MKYKLWINGKWTDSKNGNVLEVENPATGEIFDCVPNASTEDVDLAVKAAKNAFYNGEWSRMTPKDRSQVMYKMADIIESRMEEIAGIETEDTGKPYEFCSYGSDLPFSVDNLRFFAGAARSTSGDNAGEYSGEHTSIFRREPCGVTAGICPWNYPFMMAIWKIGPALAAGCTSVIKPASVTPRSTMLLGEIAKEAGVPDGVLNIITGNIGRAIVEHLDIRLVSITGATDTGKHIMRSAADTVKHVHLELGGKAPAIIFGDADIQTVAEKITLGAFFNTGQDCTAATRILIENSKLNDFSEAIVEEAKKLKVGMPFERETQVGPLVSSEQKETVSGFVEKAKHEGAKVLLGGKSPKELEAGHFYEPTILTNVQQASEIVQKEVFGPVITIQTFETEKEAIAMGNDVDFGLAASVFTSDVARAMRISANLEAGTVWVNDHLPITSETPHGGFKQSGFGKDLSLESVHDYQITKHVMIAL